MDQLKGKRFLLASSCVDFGPPKWGWVAEWRTQPMVAGSCDGALYGVVDRDVDVRGARGWAGISFKGPPFQDLLPSASFYFLKVPQPPQTPPPGREQVLKT